MCSYVPGIATNSSDIGLILESNHILLQRLWQFHSHCIMSHFIGSVMKHLISCHNKSLILQSTFSASVHISFNSIQYILSNANNTNYNVLLHHRSWFSHEFILHKVPKPVWIIIMDSWLTFLQTWVIVHAQWLLFTLCMDFLYLLLWLDLLTMFHDNEISPSETDEVFHSRVKESLINCSEDKFMYICFICLKVASSPNTEL